MIIRIWRGKVRKDAIQSFQDNVNNHDIPILNSQPGCIQTLVGKQKGSDTEYLILTIWEDLDSLKKFTGPEWKKSVPGPTEESLLEGVAVVEHYSLTPFQ